MIHLITIIASFGISGSFGGIGGAIDDGARWMTCVYTERGPVTRVERCAP